LLLLEAADSTYRERIEHAAREAGLVVQRLDNLEAAPADAPLIGVGPSVTDPLQVARALRQRGGHALLVFFTRSSSARDALRAELIRDPFIYPRYELIEVPANAHQLAARMGRVIAQVERQSHARATARPRRLRPRQSAARLQGSAFGEQYLTSILAHASDAIFSTDDAGRILTWNEASERLFGFTADEVREQPVSFLDGSAASIMQLGLLASQVLDSGEAEHAQLTCRSRTGSLVQVSVSVAPVREVQGALVGLSVVARDDSKYQRIEEALRVANRQKDEFLAIMSHELRTPLTSILGYTDMLLRGLSGPLPPLTNKYIGNVRSAGDRLLELVNGLLDYTRLEAGVERLELRPVDLSRVVGQEVQHFQAQAQSKAIDLRLAVGIGVAARVNADEDKLTHVLRGMLNNALKFTPDRGWVAVHLGPDPDEPDSVRVSVADSGIGMRDEVVPRVWERFYQGDASLTRPYGGMGLGLSIACHLVTLHGGTVGAMSNGPGTGSTFWFSLPLGSAS
jgi:PAS domain S-box-containing protein